MQRVPSVIPCLTPNHYICLYNMNMCPHMDTLQLYYLISMAKPATILRGLHGIAASQTPKRSYVCHCSRG